MEYRKSSKQYKCFDDCDSFGCPGHTIEITESDEGSVEVRKTTKNQSEYDWPDLHELKTIAEVFQEVEKLWGK